MKDEKLIHEIEKSRHAIRRKYNSLKAQTADSEAKYTQKYKPLIQPLKEIIDLSKTQKEIKPEIPLKIEKNEDIKKQDGAELDDIYVAERTPLPESDVESEAKIETSTRVEPSLVKRYMDYVDKKQSVIDKIYGPVGQGRYLYLGNQKLSLDFETDSIKVGCRGWETTTEGLLELVFKAKPSAYTSEDLKRYIDILEYANVHKKNFDSKAEIRANNTYKYRNIIKPNIKDISGKGIGELKTNIMKHNSKPTNYVYWDSADELVDRLRLLIGEKSAGHTGVDNEISSIIEELEECGVINKTY